MKKYLVTFDLDTADDDRNAAYNSAEEYLGTFKYHEKPMRNTYLVADEDDKISAVEIRDALRDLFDNEDKIIVVSLNEEAAWKNCDSETKDIKALLNSK